MASTSVGNIQDVYEKDTSSPHLGIALCPKITKQHIYLTPFSNNYLAAQVHCNYNTM